MFRRRIDSGNVEKLLSQEEINLEDLAVKLRSLTKKEIPQARGV